VVEHDLAKVGVEGSNPFARSRFFQIGNESPLSQRAFRCLAYHNSRCIYAPPDIRARNHPAGRLRHSRSRRIGGCQIAAGGKIFLISRCVDRTRGVRFSPAPDVVAFDGLVHDRADQNPSLETQK
jgi:hypothetical protein